MKLIDFLHYIIENLGLDYESQYYMFGFLDALHICDNSVTVKEFGNPFFCKLYDLLIMSGKLKPIATDDCFCFEDNFANHSINDNERIL